MLARFAHLNLYQLLPVVRTSEALQDLYGSAPSPTIVKRVGRRTSGELVIAEQRLESAVESGLRVAGGNGWIHVASADALHAQRQAASGGVLTCLRAE